MNFHGLLVPARSLVAASSPAFEALPPIVREKVYARMWRVLSGDEKDPRYAKLSPSDRRAVIEILRATKTTLPEYFRIG